MRFQDLPRSAHPDFDLRRIREDDLPTLFSHLRDPAIIEAMGEGPTSVAEIAWSARDGSAVSESSPLRLAISSRETGALVGTVGLHSALPRHRSVEIACDLAPGLWGRGVAAQMTSSMVDWAHRELRCARVQATALPENNRSIALLDRCGFQREGLLRSCRVVGGRSRDFLVYSHIDLG